MDSVAEISRKMKEHFDGLWNQGDVWSFETSAYERQKYARQIELIAGRRYGRVLELGCGAGQFTRMLAPHADHVLAVDVSPAAIDRARSTQPVPGNVEFRAVDVMELDLHDGGPWDLITMSETVCCLGWLYSCFQLGWLASDMLLATNVGGRFLMANTFNSQKHEYLLRPWLLYTYRDLFLHVGYELETEERFSGDKDGVRYDALISLFQKTGPSVAPNDVFPVESRDVANRADTSGAAE